LFASLVGKGIIFSQCFLGDAVGRHFLLIFKNLKKLPKERGHLFTQSFTLFFCATAKLPAVHRSFLLAAAYIADANRAG
jgi:hypothetical protein